jgi:zinc protease
MDLGKVLTGKVADVGVAFSDTEEVVSGSGSPQDLETLFQLIHLTFTQPRADAEIFSVITAQTKIALSNQRAQPEYAFQEAQVSALTQNHPRRRLMTPEMIDQLSLDRAMAFYKDRLADASDFTFVFAGSFTVDAMKPLVEQYLASLPAIRRTETWKDVGVRPPRGVVERRVEKGIEPKSQTSLVFTGPFQYDPARRVAIRAMAMAVETRLREVLREDLGGTYSVGVGAGYSKVPRPEYSVSISFGSAPDRTDALVTRVFEEMAKFKAEGPSESQVNDVRTAMQREYETSLKSNDYLAAQMSFKYLYGEDVAGVFSATQLFNALTPAMLRDAARQYLDTANYVKVQLFPEKR